jgi:hypothetical protein
MGKDFTPQRHSHLRMIAHPSPRAAMGGNAGTSARSLTVGYAGR